MNPLQADPQNDLCWRFDMRRLRAEELRDSILSVTNSLNIEAMYGPSIFPTIEQEVLAGQSVPGQGWNKSSPEDQRRRSVYVHLKRSLTVPLLANFDVADTDFTCPVRFATTQPTQALGLLNGAFLQEQSQLLSDDLKQASTDEPTQVQLALKRVTQREPTPDEIARGLQLLKSLQAEQGLSPSEALRYFCLLALNLNEFVYLD